MSLDLSKAAAQIDGMAVDLRARQSDREERVQRAVRAAREFPLDDDSPMGEPGEEAHDWPLAQVLHAPDSRHVPPTLPDDFCVAAVDGSHIDVDRHLPVRCFLINCGVSVLTYGSRPEAELSNRPRLYARDEELVIRDASSYREQAIEGAVLGAKRTVEEIRTLVEIIRELPRSTPTLTLLDGSLVMLGLVGPLNQDFVLRELVEEGFAGALEELREMAADRSMAIASYISLPGSAEVVGALRRTVCAYEDSDAAYRCSRRGPGPRPCGECVGGGAGPGRVLPAT